MSTRNNLHKLRPSRNKTSSDASTITRVRKTEISGTGSLTAQNTIERLNHKRLHSDIIESRSIRITEIQLLEERVKTTGINDIGNKRSHNHEITRLIESERTFAELLTSRGLTSKRTKGTTGVIRTSSLVNDIRTEVLTVSTEENRRRMILNTGSVELRVHVIRPATTIQRQINPTLNMRHSRDITHRNRLTIGFKIHLNFGILITGCFQPRFKIVRRQTPLENRRTRTQPLPRTEVVFGNKRLESLNRVRGSLDRTKQLFNKRNVVLNIDSITDIRFFPRSRRNSGNLLIDIVIINHIQISQHLNHVERSLFRTNGPHRGSKTESNGDIHIVGERTRRNNTIGHRFQSSNISKINSRIRNILDIQSRINKEPNQGHQ